MTNYIWRQFLYSDTFSFPDEFHYNKVCLKSKNLKYFMGYNNIYKCNTAKVLILLRSESTNDSLIEKLA